MPVIELDNLSKWYGEVIGLNNVTSAIDHGITGLLGANGAGKSTLMSLAMGQLRPSKGSIRVLGQRVWDRPGVLSQIGYCPEGDPFWPNLTGYRFVLFLAKASGLRGSAAVKAARYAIELTGMTEHAGRAIRGYSKGMRQRIKIAQTLVHRPKLLILDEPFTGTDPVARHELGNLLRDLVKEGVDILISSHVLHEVEALTKQILLIDHGRIVAQGDLQAVRRTMRDRPHAIRVRVDQPRRLAADLATLDIVAGLRVSSSDTLTIETPWPERVYDLLPNLILDRKLSVREIAAADESLEAVFDYLTQREG
ncbi:MAG: ABC transporter ATP-binding protein [Phycisphaerales bacterium]|nr:MAG: ABC transporter ATP-binding protein [Phycisphaerales bacterium]